MRKYSTIIIRVCLKFVSDCEKGFFYKNVLTRPCFRKQIVGIGRFEDVVLACLYSI